MACGYMDVYSDTYEKIKHDLKSNADIGANQFGAMPKYEGWVILS